MNYCLWCFAVCTAPLLYVITLLSLMYLGMHQSRIFLILLGLIWKLLAIELISCKMAKKFPSLLNVVTLLATLLVSNWLLYSFSGNIMITATSLGTFTFLFFCWLITLRITFSIYKAVLKSKSSINEVNQIAQVCSPDKLIESVWHLNSCVPSVNLSFDIFVILKQLRIIIKPKTSAGVGPLCNAHQVTRHSVVSFFNLLH